MPHPRRPTTPLRRSSLSSLSLSASASSHPAGSHRTSPSPLEHLSPLLADLADELASLHSNVHAMAELDTALGTFNEGFAELVWGLRLNAYCVEWPEAPTQQSFDRMEELAAAAAAAATRLVPLPPASPPPPSASEQTLAPSTAAGDMTYRTQNDTILGEEETPKAAPKAAAGAKPRPKGKINPALKKKRETFVEGIIDTLPLEYRGSQPALRTAMSQVLHGLIRLSKSPSTPPAGARVPDLVKMPDLPQARVNKCLIALVQKKVVAKTNEGGVAYYRLNVPVPS